MVIVTCPVPACGWTSEDRDLATLGALLAAKMSAHTVGVHPPPNTRPAAVGPPPALKTPKVNPPLIDLGGLQRRVLILQEVVGHFQGHHQDC
jgi:hypothetical protein